MTAQSSKIRWLRVVPLTLAADVILVGTAILLVAVWAHVIRPGLPAAAYEAFAAVASPWVSVLAGMPLFYFGARFVARSRPRDVVAIVALYIAIDVAIVVAFADDLTYVALMSVLSHATKIGAAWFGVKSVAT